MDSIVESGNKDDTSTQRMQSVCCFYLVGESVASNLSLRHVLANYIQKNPDCESKECSENDIVAMSKRDELKSKSTNCVYVLKSPECPVYDLLIKSNCIIHGIIFLVQCLGENWKRYCINNNPLMYTRRPIFSLSMNNVSVYFSGFPETTENVELLEKLSLMVHWMGGKVRINFKVNNNNITHLIANTVRNKMYEICSGLSIGIMSPEWIVESWKLHSFKEFFATSFDMVEKYKLRAFQGLTLMFHEFPPDELKIVKSMALNNGAVVWDENVQNTDSSSLTHLILWTNYIMNLPEDVSLNSLNLPYPDALIVSCQWFYGCVHLQSYIPERNFLVFDSTNSLSDSRKDRSDDSVFRTFSRKICRSPLMYLSPKSPNLALSNSRQSLEMENRLQLPKDGSFENIQSITTKTLEKVSLQPDAKTEARQHIFHQLLATEKSYVEFLRVLIEIFRKSLEQCAVDNSGAIMSNEAIKFIFDPVQFVYEYHQKLLVELIESSDPWNDQFSIGQFFMRKTSDFLPIYSTYFNSYEQMVDLVKHHDKANQRFHAFLQVCISIPECEKQGLTELLMKPVQRLFHYTLFLKDLTRETSSNHSDHPKLLEALHCVEQTLRDINELKKQWESHYLYIEMVNKIQYCPSFLYAPERKFLVQVDVNDVTKSCKNSRIFTLFIFTDCIEVAKRKNKPSQLSSILLASPCKSSAASSSNYSLANISSFSNNNDASIFSTSLNTGSSKPSNYTHKHVHLIHMNDIELLINVEDGYEVENRLFKNTFGIGYRLSSQFFSQYDVLPLGMSDCNLSSHLALMHYYYLKAKNYQTNTVIKASEDNSKPPYCEINENLSNFVPYFIHPPTINSPLSNISSIDIHRADVKSQLSHADISFNSVDLFDNISMCSNSTMSIDKYLFRVILNTQTYTEVSNKLSQLIINASSNFDSFPSELTPEIDSKSPRHSSTTKSGCVKLAILKLLYLLIRTQRGSENLNKIVFGIRSKASSEPTANSGVSNSKLLNRSASFLGKAIEKAVSRTKRMSKVFSSSTLGKLTGLVRTNSMCASEEFKQCTSSNSDMIPNSSSSSSESHHLATEDAHPMDDSSVPSKPETLPTPNLSIISNSDTFPIPSVSRRNSSSTLKKAHVVTENEKSFLTPKSGVSASKRASSGRSLLKRLSSIHKQ